MLEAKESPGAQLYYHCGWAGGEAALVAFTCIDGEKVWAPILIGGLSLLSVDDELWSEELYPRLQFLAVSSSKAHFYIWHAVEMASC